MLPFPIAINNGIPIFGFPSFSQKKAGRLQNDSQYFDAFCNLVDLFVNIFEWTGLPETCNQRILETQLLFNGASLFFQHKDNSGFFHCPFTFNGAEMNIYNENTHYRTNSPTHQQDYDDTNAVIIRSTPLMFPLWLTLDIYAKKTVDAQRTIDVYQHTLKRPFLIRGGKDTLLTIKKIVEAQQENEYLLITDKKSFNPEDLQYFPIPTDPEVLAKMWDHLHNLQDELYKRFGIQSARNDKKERMVVSEAQSNEQITQSNIMYMLDSRLAACDEINKLFGLNISCKLKHEIVEDDPESGYLEDGEGEEND